MSETYVVLHTISCFLKYSDYSSFKVFYLFHGRRRLCEHGFETKLGSGMLSAPTVTRLVYIGMFLKIGEEVDLVLVS